MNPAWVVVRPRRGSIAPLQRGAGEVVSVGLHARPAGGHLWRVTIAHPHDCEDVMLCAREALTPSLLDALARLALPTRDRRSLVVWTHGLADLMLDLFAAFREGFARSTEPVVTWTGAAGVIAWEAYHQTAPGRVELRTAEMPLDPEPFRGWELPAFRLAMLRGPVGAATLTVAGRKAIRLLDSRAYVKADLDERSARSLVAWTLHAREQGLTGVSAATATRAIGERVADVWRVLDVPPGPTPAATAAKHFKRSFLGGPLQQVPYHVESAAELAFHGGKIGLWVAKKSVVPRVYIYDLRSAYAWALTLIPSFYAGEWRRTTILSAIDWTRQRITHGFARITCSVKPCRWPVIPSHVGQWVRSGRVERLWTTTYELSEAIRCKEVDLERAEVWYWVERSDRESPWKAFSEEVFKRRDACTDALRDVYKGGLVGLYGKTVQRSTIPPLPPDGAVFDYGVPVAYCRGGKVDDNRPRYFRAGGFYYPVVGSLVTGIVRARMHAVEHAYEAVHSAVDAVHVLRPIPDDQLGPGLGQWRYLGEGRGEYAAANQYLVVGPGFRKRAAAGVPAAITVDDEQEIAL